MPKFIMRIAVQMYALNSSCVAPLTTNADQYVGPIRNHLIQNGFKSFPILSEEN